MDLNLLLSAVTAAATVVTALAAIATLALGLFNAFADAPDCVRVPSIISFPFIVPFLGFCRGASAPRGLLPFGVFRKWVFRHSTGIKED